MPDLKPYAGGCHCGAVRFTATAELGKVIECNCSHCAMKGLLLTFVPVDAVTLEKGEDALTEYRFNTRRIGHFFCSTCGVQPFARAKAPDGADTVALNVRTFDGVDLTRLERMPYDGASK